MVFSILAVGSYFEVNYFVLVSQWHLNIGLWSILDRQFAARIIDVIIEAD